ncbi:hypothetical protein CLOP_g9089 [Closterium sp. NIES-67]|nr:hypothetical protein CLOP_g9089 [Closterium sp. NIES-67]
MDGPLLGCRSAVNSAVNPVSLSGGPNRLSKIPLVSPFLDSSASHGGALIPGNSKIVIPASTSPLSSHPRTRVATPRVAKPPSAVLYEPPSFLRDAATVRRMAERDFGSGHGVLYDTPQRGSATPYGATAVDNGVNFAVHSSGATAVSVCLFTPEGLAQGKPSAEVPLHPILNRTGDVWHIYLPALSRNLLYGYRIDGPFAPQKGHRFDASKIVLDPYAKAVLSRETYGEVAPGGECWPQMAGMVPHKEDDEYDWEGDTPPRHAMKDLVIYEAHVRGFTRHGSSGVQHPGTYQGLVEKLPYLQALGVTAVELLPTHEFNELEYYAYNPITNDYKMNFWGYSTVGYFAPMIRYAAAGSVECGRAAVREFKDMVRACHRHGIEVILDVVFNHTAEGNELGPTITFRGIDNRVFYMTAPMGEFYNYSGCGNTFNCNHPVVRKFIVDCLRYWVQEMHVDGFRFDLAAILTRSSSLWDRSNVYGTSMDGGGSSGESSGEEGDGVTTGSPLAEPPLIDAISNDPVLRDVKLIAEAWDAGGLYQVGNFPHWGVWAEWNGQYRDAVRQFVKGTDGTIGMFAEALCGSPNLYKPGGRRPWHSINFVTAHDGFTLGDLVAYTSKHNEANGNDNTDGEEHNLSWNCGEEGVPASVAVERLRQRQIRNFILALFVSQGVPMVHMGDEYAHTKDGNNNTYCHDSQMNYFNWDRAAEDSSGVLRFFRAVAALRKEFKCFRLDDFPTAHHLQWHGLTPANPDWSDTSRFIAFTIHDDEGTELYVAFNTSHLPSVATLPDRYARTWQLLVDTSKPPPYDVLSPDLPAHDRAIAVAQSAPLLAAGFYPLLGYSAVVLQSVADD